MYLYAQRGHLAKKAASARQDIINGRLDCASPIERLKIVHVAIKSGRIFTGTICRFETYGLLIEISWGRGLVHISQIPKEPGWYSKYNVGQIVNVRIIMIDKLGRLSLCFS
jgi:polyribonucleotide nucleotidyltransferase